MLILKYNFQASVMNGITRHISTFYNMKLDQYEVRSGLKINMSTLIVLLLRLIAAECWVLIIFQRVLYAKMFER